MQTFKTHNYVMSNKQPIFTSNQAVHNFNWFELQVYHTKLDFSKTLAAAVWHIVTLARQRLDRHLTHIYIVECIDQTLIDP